MSAAEMTAPRKRNKFVINDSQAGATGTPGKLCPIN